VLGITYHKSLKWDTHVNYIIKAAGRRVNVLRYLRRIGLCSVSKKDLVTVYNNYILSILEFNCPLFVGLNKKNAQKLERIRKRCHRIVCGSDCDCDDFPSLHERRQEQAMRTFSTIMHTDNISHCLLPNHLPRTNLFRHEYMKTNRRANSFIPHCVTLWNLSEMTKK